MLVRELQRAVVRPMTRRAAAVAGYAAVAAQVGSRLRGRDAVAMKVTILDLFIGFALISALTLMAHGLMIGSGPAGPFLWMMRAAGWFVEWIAWTVGLGAALASVFGGRQRVTPSSIPYATAAPTVS